MAGHQFHQARQRQDPVVHQFQGQGQACLEPDDAVGGQVELQLLFDARMGCVVAGNRVDGAVGQALADGVPVGRRAQGRIHFHVGVVVAHGFVIQGEMVRRGLGCYRDTLRLGDPDGIHGLACADMRKVEFSAREACQGDVALDHGALGDVGDTAQSEPCGGRPLVHGPVGRKQRVLAMGDDGAARASGVFQRTAHQQAVGHRQAIVGESHRTGRREFVKRRQSLSGQTGADGRHRIDPGGPGALCPFQNEFGHLGTVVGRMRVGHGADGRKTSGDGGAAAAGDGFLVFLARFAQMDVKVDQPGGDDFAAGSDHLHAFFRLACSPAGFEGGDSPLIYIEVGLPVEMARIDDAPAADDQVHRYLPPSTRYKRAMRTATPLVTCSRMTA